MTDRPQPTINADGIGICSQECPHYRGGRYPDCTIREIGGGYQHMESVCLPWVRGLVVEIAVLRAAVEVGARVADVAVTRGSAGVGVSHD